MTKRLQVTVTDSDYRQIQRMARSRRMSIAEWVRQALEPVVRRESLGDVDKKLEAIRAAAQHNFPVADIDQMLAEIGKGYGTLRTTNH